MKKQTRLIAMLLALLTLVLQLPLAVITISAVEEYDYSYTEIVDRLIDPRYLARSAEGERSYMASSYSRASEYDAVTDSYVEWNSNSDGSGYISKIDDDGDGLKNEFLIAEAEGAGYVSRIWSASPKAGRVRIYVDGEVILDMPFADYFNGVGFSWSELSYGENDADAAMGHNLYVPITFNESLRIVAYQGWGEFYQVNYTLMPEGKSVEPMPSVLTDAQKERLTAVNDFFTNSIGTSPYGEETAEFETLVASPDAPAVKTLSGKGAITGLRLRVNGYDDIPAQSQILVDLLKELEIRIYWDGAEDAAVIAPLGDFFGSAYAYDPIRTLLLGVGEDRVFYNYHYMPYLEGARIEIANRGSEDVELSLSVSTEAHSIPAEDLLYFYAQFTNGTCVDAEDRFPDHRFLDVTGEGRFVGLSLHVHKKETFRMENTIPGYNWWGEGDEKFFVDGEKFPSWFGTGTEDFFGYAWCNETLFNRAYHSQSYYHGNGMQEGNHVLYRGLMADNVPFSESFEGCLEKYYGDVNNGYTAYYYLANGSGVKETEGATDGKSIDLYLIAGQSNAAGYTSIQDAAAIYEINPSLENGFSNVLYSGKSDYDAALTPWAPATLGHGHKSGFFGPEAGLAVALSQKYNEESGRMAGILKYAHGGTTLSGNDTVEEHNWVSPSYAAARGWSFGTAHTGGQYLMLLEVFKAQVAALLESGYTEISLKGIYWMQGESDRTENEEYYEAMQCLIEDLRADLSAAMTELTARDGGAKDLQFFLGSISATYHLYAANATEVNRTFIETQRKIACQNDRCHFIDNSAYRISTFNTVTGKASAIGSDTHHWGQADMLRIGVNVGERMLQYDGEGYTGYYDYDATAHIPDFIEGEALQNVTVSGGTLQRQTNQNGYNWSGKTNLLWLPGGTGKTLSFSLPAAKDGEYVIVGSFLTAKDFGIFDVAVNGETTLQGLDLYTETLLCEDLVYLGKAELSRGYDNEMSFTVTGKNASSRGYLIGIDFLLMIPAREYLGLSEIDLSKYTNVSRYNAKEDGFIEAEDMMLTSTPSIELGKQRAGGGLSGSMQIFWQNKAAGNSATFALHAPEAGEYAIYVSYMRAVDFGIVKASVNGTAMGSECDLYYAGDGEKLLIVDTLQMIGTAKLTEGYTNSITFTVTGKNPSSKNYFIGVDFIYLVPVGQTMNLGEYTSVTRSIFIDDERKLEAEGLNYAFEGTANVPKNQKRGDRSGGYEFFWPANGTNCKMTFDIPAGKTGTYALYASFIYASDFGIYDAYVNGKLVRKGLDLYSKSLRHDDLVMLGTAELCAGYSNKLAFLNTGKNPAATKIYFGIDYIVAVPIGEDGICDSAETPISEDVYFEGEDLISSSSTGGRRMPWRNKTLESNASNGVYMFWTPNVGDKLEITLPAASGGKYAVVASFLHASDYGYFSVAANGTMLMESLELYTKGSGVVKTSTLTMLGVADMTLGYDNKLTFTSIKKNTENNRGYFGLDFLILIPYEEFGGLDHVDLSKYNRVTRDNAEIKEFVEAETLFTEITNSAGSLGTPNGTIVSDGVYLTWQNTDINIKIYAPEDGDYALLLAFIKQANGAIWQVDVNGVPTGCHIDTYSAKVRANDINYIGNVPLKKGNNILTLRRVGQNPAAQANAAFGSLDFVIVLPADQFDAASFDASVYTSREVSALLECKHSYDGGVVTTPSTCLEGGEAIYTCTVCGEKKTEKLPIAEHTDNGCGYCEVCQVKITGASVTLGKDLSINYFVRILDKTLTADLSALAMRFTFNGKSETVSATVPNGDGEYVFTFSHIAPQQMSDNLSAELLLGDTVIARHEEYSVKANAQALLTKYADDTALVQLITDLLTYGDAAQAYLDYNAEDPATRGVKGLGTPSEALPTEGDGMKLTGNANGDAYVISANVWFDTFNRLAFEFYAKDIDTVTVTLNGVALTPAQMQSLGDGRYRILTNGLTALRFDDICTLTLSLDGETVSTVEYSINAYAWAMTDGTEASEMRSLALALYRYGRSAENCIAEE